MKLVIWVELYLSEFHAEASVLITQHVAVLANRSAKRWLGPKGPLVSTGDCRDRRQLATNRREVLQQTR